MITPPTLPFLKILSNFGSFSKIRLLQAITYATWSIQDQVDFLWMHEAGCSCES